MRAAWCDISLEALEQNARALIAGAGVPILPMVKADAYGHGALQAVRRLAAVEGVWGMGVAVVSEAAELRQGGFQGRILLLGGLLADEAAEAAALRASVAISSMSVAEALARAASGRGETATVHLKVDIGMHRLGIPFEEAEEAAERIAAMSSLHLEGVLTHLAGAHEGDEESRRRTREELDRFYALVTRLRDRHGPLLAHAANSSTLLVHGGPPCDLVRPGLTLYGWRPAGWLPEDPPITPVIGVRARVAVVKTSISDALVGYSQTALPQGRRLGVLPIGYGDGIPQRLGLEGGYVLFATGRAPMVGSVSMDSLVVDITDLPGEGEGSTALLMGHGPEGTIPPAEVAAMLGRSPYELLVGLTARLPRRYPD